MRWATCVYNIWQDYPAFSPQVPYTVFFPSCYVLIVLNIRSTYDCLKLDQWYMYCIVTLVTAKYSVQLWEVQQPVLSQQEISKLKGYLKWLHFPDEFDLDAQINWAIGKTEDHVIDIILQIWNVFNVRHPSRKRACQWQSCRFIPTLQFIIRMRKLLNFDLRQIGNIDEPDWLEISFEEEYWHISDQSWKGANDLFNSLSFICQFLKCQCHSVMVVFD